MTDQTTSTPKNESSNVASSHSAHPVHRKHMDLGTNKPFIIALASAGVLLLMVIVMGTFIFMAMGSIQNRTSSNNGMQSQYGTNGNSMQPIFRQRQSNSIDGSNGTSQQSADRVSGVVLSVGNGSFVMAGMGKQYTVTTNDSTIYNTQSKSVAPNDTVRVIGQINGTSVTAAQITVVNGN